VTTYALAILKLPATFAMLAPSCAAWWQQTSLAVEPPIDAARRGITASEVIVTNTIMISSFM
jgi:hypothetical protein